MQVLSECLFVSVGDMRIAVQLHPQHATYAEIRDAALKAEDLGVDAIYNWDHFFPLYGDGDGMHYEAWTMLGSWAEITSTVKIGCLVTCNSYRNPQLVADMARTVDCIADGRLVLGLGSGWFERDYDEYGYDFKTAGKRLDDLEQALPLLQNRLARVNPPAPGPMPILIGGGGEKKTLRYVARHGDIWHSFWNHDNPEVFDHKNNVLAKWCEVEGTDNSKIERSVGVDVGDMSDAELTELFNKLEAAGVDEVTIGAGGPDYVAPRIGEFLAWRDSLNS